MLENKHSFWEALIAAFIILLIGILIGVYFENLRIKNIEEFYFDSQTDILDFELSSELNSNYELDCERLKENSILFADKIYEEAKKLEKYDDSNKITIELIYLHRRYDLLRTVLWEDIIEMKKRCENINTIVYLYQYKNPSLNTKVTQGTISNILLDLKKEYSDEIILIPIAVDTNVESLEILRKFYNLDKFPVVFVNEKHKFESLDSLKDIKKFLGESNTSTIYLN